MITRVYCRMKGLPSPAELQREDIPTAGNGCRLTHAAMDASCYLMHTFTYQHVLWVVETRAMGKLSLMVGVASAGQSLELLWAGSAPQTHWKGRQQWQEGRRYPQAWARGVVEAGITPRYAASAAATQIGAP